MLRFIRRYSWPYPGRITVAPSDLLHIHSCMSFIFAPRFLQNFLFQQKMQDKLQEKRC